MLGRSGVKGCWRVAPPLDASGKELKCREWLLREQAFRKAGREPIEIDAIAATQHDCWPIRDAPRKAEARRNIVVPGRKKPGNRRTDYAIGHISGKIGRNDKTTERSLRRSCAGGDCWIKRYESAVDVRGSPKDLVAQPGIQCERWPDFYVILKEGGEIGVSFIFSEQAGTSVTEGDIAASTGTAVLRRALTKQKVVEGSDVKKPIGSE